MIFDVGDGGTAQRNTPTPLEKAIEALPSAPEDTRMLDLRDLAKRTRQSLATVPEVNDLDVPLSVREAILLVDSIAPSSVQEEPAEVAPPSSTSTPSSAARRRLHAIYTGIGLLVVMAGLVAAKARVGREVASAAGLAPDQIESTVLLSVTPQTRSTEASPAAVAPSATSTATAAPTSTSSPRKTPLRPAPPRPKAPVPADTPEIRATAEPVEPTKEDLLDAMAAAVSAHSAPPAAVTAAPKVDCLPGPPDGSGTPSPCARAATRTSPLHP